jgi:phosphatidylinositol alpha-1,6-mannosyltransferase
VRLLLVTQDFPPRPGGMARYYADLVRGLGSECTVAAGSWDGVPPEPEGGAAVLPFPWDARASHRFVNLLRTRRLIRRAVEENPPDAILSGNARPYSPVLLPLAAQAGVPLVQIYHGNDLLRTARRWGSHPFKRSRWKRLASRAALHVTNSRFSAGLAARAGLPPGRTRVVPPEVDTGRFHPPRDPEEKRRLRARLGWPADEVISLFVGRLVERKGLSDLFAVLPTLPAGLRLLVAGPGDATAWGARARARGAGDRVRFLGHASRDELPLFYRAADLFVMPSVERPEQDDVEGFGIVFLEASASGLPVLAARSGGVPEAVEDGVGGILVPPGDRAALAEAWRRLAADADTRRALGEGGRAGRAREHGPGSSARRLREALREAGIGR